LRQPQTGQSLVIESSCSSHARRRRDAESDGSFTELGKHAIFKTTIAGASSFG